MGTAEVMAKVASDVQQFGWHCISVAPRQGESGSHWSYTIGLCENLNHPEIAIFGLSAKTAHGILSDCVEAIRAGKRYALGNPVTGVVKGDIPVEFRLVKAEHLREKFGAATRYYGERPLQVTVMFWPTKDGKFPWETTTLTGQEEAVNVV
jgi:hypothetical protein